MQATLRTQYNEALSRDAAESGVAYAKYCYKKIALLASATQWPKAGTLDTGDNCYGEAQASNNCTTPLSAANSCFIVKNNNVRTSFSVSAVNTVGASYVLTSKGITSVVQQSSGASVQTWDASLSSTGYVDLSGLAYGNDTSCAIQVSKLYCWGYNTDGQTGTGAAGSSVLTPTMVQGALTGKYVYSVATGILHTCALAGDSLSPDATSRLYCWGDNSEYQYGTNSTANSYSPTLAASVPGYTFTSLSTSWHSCAIAQDSTNRKAYCWGKNDQLQAGEDSTTNAAAVTSDPKTQPNAPLRTGNSTSTELTSVSYIEAVSSDITCGINASQAFCMGQNANGASGQGTTGADSARPLLISSLTSTTKIATNNGRVCALNAGKIYCWGSNNGWRMDSGPNFTTSATVAKTPITSPTRPHTSAAANGLYTATVTDFAISDYNMCIIVSGSVWCSGYNDRGQLGQGTMTGPVSVEYPIVNTPAQNARATNTSELVSANNAVKVGGALSKEVAVRVVGGNNHFCAVTSLGNLYCWGANYYGQLGDGTQADQSLPVRVKLPPTVIY